MCQHCCGDKKESRNFHLSVSEQLEQLAECYRSIAHKREILHSEDAKLISIRARNIVRILVEEWV